MDKGRPRGKKEAEQEEKTFFFIKKKDYGESKSLKQKEKTEVDVGDQKLVAEKAEL